MKPIKIEFTAFGPYAQTQTVDFSKMTNSNMFIITGPTGSGKTTIFDAMSFALYGSASGSERSNDMFRSDFAADTVETEVTFEFISNNIVYKINRKPAQHRPKLRGEGMRKVDSSVKLEFKDQVYTAQTEVTSKIEEIIGLTKEQFKQIVLLPQGEFKKLLVSDSRSKEEIFRKIFNTSHIKRIQENLRVESSILKRQIEDSELKINTFLSHYSNVTNTKQLTYAKLNAKLNYEQLTTEKNKIDTKLDTIKIQLEAEATYKQNILELEQVGAALNNYQQNQDLYKLYSSFIDHVPILVNYQNQVDSLNSKQSNLTNYQNQSLEFKQQLEQIKIKLTDSEKKFGNIKQQYDNLDSNRSNVNQIERSLESIAEQLIIKKAIEQHKERLEVLNKTKLELNSTIAQLKKQHAQITINIEHVDCNNNKIDKLEHEINKISKQLEVEQEIQKLKTKISDNNKQGIKLTNELELETSNLSALRTSYFSAQAGNLAKQLKPGIPCPVCGSADHPSPATLFDSDASIENIKKQEVIVTNLSQELGKLSSLIEVDKALCSKLSSEYQIEEVDYKQRLETLTSDKEQLETKNKQLDINIDTVTEKMNTSSQQLQELEIELNKTEYMITEKSLKLTLDDEMLLAKDELEIKLSQQQKLITSITSDYQTMSSTVQNLKSISDKLETNIKFNCNLINTTTSEIEQLLAQIKSIELSFKDNSLDTFLQLLPDQANIQKQYNDYITNKVLLESKLKDLSKATDSYVPIDIEQLTNDQQKLLKTSNHFKNMIEDYHAYITRLTSDLNALIEIESSIKSIYDKYQLVADISDIANGKTISKISFERYMLSIYFKQIINRANIYFKTMTNNRFELEYKSPAKGRSAQGLDLNIIDNYTTKVRDVKTLSGGESFKAALSMALGLSDIVQMNSGGIQIDTIFIDEGFGSLDIDSLNTAIDTLINIETEGRMVGIISHVEELKNQVSNKIIITPSTSGSSLRTNFS